MKAAKTPKSLKEMPYLPHKKGSFSDLINTYFNPLYFCHDMNIFWPASFVNFPWHCWTEFSQSWKDLRITLRSHENFQSLTDLSGANIGIHSNSRDWLFWMFMMSKINPLMNKSVLFWKDVFSTVFSIFIKIAKMRF